MTAIHSFAPIRTAYRIHQAAADSWWVYHHDVGKNGNLSLASRVVFFGNSQSQVKEWIQSRNDQQVFLLGEI